MDEADRLLEKSQIEDIIEINEFLPKEKQVILTSATIDERKIKKSILEKFSSKEFFFLNVNNQLKTVETLEQNYILIPKAIKEFYLVHIV